MCSLGLQERLEFFPGVKAPRYTIDGHSPTGTRSFTSHYGCEYVHMDLRAPKAAVRTMAVDTSPTMPMTARTTVSIEGTVYIQRLFKNTNEKTTRQGGECVQR